ncbi:DUF3915 domain-containing protein [Bacillus clarus]|uniref:DUF3915 domain-containing protein n=1 Tax=Bacillus clarus TaxID=2338372 RepID=A0A090YXC0_9BACI|nr:DUF3915 domain-containing protein [Bacillus clarus]KFN03017.1 hypothetical protein DJ93_1037 [Bacillus clarus]RFT68843.1 DUF3915 domain-containing protein [Bacillus clarus]
MFGSFGCCDNFRECHHRERECHHREKEEVKEQRPAVCNVLASISVGTELSLLSIRGNGTFRNVIFEGFANGVALFSALAMNDKNDNKDDKNNPNTNTFTGILRVCPTDIVAIAI